MEVVRHFKKYSNEEYVGPEQHDPIRRLISKVILQAIQEVCDKKQGMRTRMEAFKWLFFEKEEHASVMREYALTILNYTEAALMLKVMKTLGKDQFDHFMNIVAFELREENHRKELQGPY